MPAISPAPGDSCRALPVRAERPALAAALAFACALSASAAAADCADVAAGDAARLPRDLAPRIVLLQGSLGIVTMEPLAAFLEGMGYPRGQLVDPKTGALTSDSDLDGRTLAGILAWQAERDRVRPMIVGHSKGGGVVIDTLHVLAGDEDLPLVDPATHAPLERSRFRDPGTGTDRRVVELDVPLAVVKATGRLPRILRGHFALAAKLRDVPDSAEVFVGMTIPFDPIAGSFAAGTDPYRARGRAQVRNVDLPVTTSHIGLPRTEHLARDPVARAWIDGWRPGDARTPPALDDASNLDAAAELWHAVKDAWCREAARTRAHGG
jgi:hypothetical protein